MIRAAPLALALACWAPLAARAAANGPAPGPDPILASLVRDALEKNPEYARARAELAAERERIPQAGALPDPTLTLGIQNDGFRGIEIGSAETSFWQVMLTQPFPWPGKRGLREAVAQGEASATEARLERVRLSTTAAVERAYVDLLLARGQLDLLGKLEVLWREAEGVARARYEVGAAPQSDLVRAQLERMRLSQQRFSLEGSEKARAQALNRLRVHPLDETIGGTRRIAEAGVPRLPTVDEAVADAEARSPELVQARRARLVAERRVRLAERDRFPDFTVSAAVMPRGSLDPMWSASVGISLPVFAGRKQLRAVAESVERREAETQGEETVQQLLRLRTRERLTALETLLKTLTLYREGLLVQSETAVRSTVAQYKVGRVPFAAVLEVMRGLVADEGGYLEALAQAQRVAIAQRELSLDPAPSAGAVVMGAGSVPGASGMASGSRASGGGGGAPEAAAPSGGGQGM